MARFFYPGRWAEKRGIAAKREGKEGRERKAETGDS